jgi:hypothetical protein
MLSSMLAKLGRLHVYYCLTLPENTLHGAELRMIFALALDIWLSHLTHLLFL